jgi:site-specific DNA-methyltransferase (cytosine-N4-specific)
MIGNREITEKERLGLEKELHDNLANLPEAVIAFCRKLHRLADHQSHGFRRLNVPALVYKYLGDMSSMFESVREVVKPGGYYGLLVGPNTTTLRGEEVAIDTPELLAEIAASRRWEVLETIPFETYHRYDVHQNNSIRAEVLILLRNTGTAGRPKRPSRRS